MAQSITWQAMFGTATLIIAISALAAVADRVHHVRGIQRQQPRLLDHDARFRDPFQRHRLLRHRLAEGDAASGPPAHHLQRAFGQPDQAHAMMDAAGAETPLRDLEAAALAEQHVVAGTRTFSNMTSEARSGTP